VRVYIAGPMTGLEDFNFPAFHVAAAAWRAEGWDVVNPAEAFDGVTDLPYRAYVDYDMAALQRCTAIAMLPGWDRPGSRGAVWERAVAQMLGLAIFSAAEPQPPIAPETILEEAQRLVYGPRQADYGHPLDDFTRTAVIWSAIIGAPVTAEKVGLCMVGLKLSRQVNHPKRDNLTDAAGYAGTVQMVIDERERREAA
jgi:uncharacterized protein DUF6378/uncharacterized protein DUF4406